MKEQLTLARCEERAANPVAVNVSSIIGEAYRLTGKHWGPLFIGLLITLVIQGALNLVPLIGQLAAVLLGPALTVGLVGFYRQILKGEEVSYATLFEYIDHFFPLFLINLVYIVFISFGTLLLILPGIYVFLVYHAAIYIHGMSNNTIGVWASLRLSRRIYHQYLGSGLVLIISLVFVNLLGALALGIGLLFTLPMSYVAYVLFLEKTLLPDNTEDSLIQSIGSDSGTRNGYRSLDNSFSSLT
jgi:hypothetical protein